MALCSVKKVASRVVLSNLQISVMLIRITTRTTSKLNTEVGYEVKLDAAL
jgi:hypothetical protein